MDKTANEQENGQYVKFTDTESSFNEKVQDIMNGVLSSSYAFVEQLEETHMDEKIFTIDINKCRRNILLNHKYDYCVFNVMDDPKEFNTGKPRGRYARVAFELVLRNLGLITSCPGWPPPSADNHPAIPGVPHGLG